jgi:hypothetical protein
MATPAAASGYTYPSVGSADKLKGFDFSKALRTRGIDLCEHPGVS